MRKRQPRTPPSSKVILMRRRFCYAAFLNMNQNVVKAGARHSVSDTQLLAQAQAILAALGAPIDNAPVTELSSDVLAGRSVENYLNMVGEAFSKIAVPANWQNEIDGYPVSRSFWLMETYATSAVVRGGEDYYLAPYTFDVDGNVVVSPLNEWKKVKKSWATKAINTISAFKSIGDSFVFGGYGILYGSAKTPDLTGDFFTPQTDLMLEQWDKRPLLYHHAMDAQTKASPVIGTVTSMTRDPMGVWVESQLDMRHQYAEGVKQLIEQGALSYSSDSTGHLVNRKSTTNGAKELTRWATIAFSLTPTPAEFRLMPVEAVKSAYAAAGIELPSALANENDIKPDVTQAPLKEETSTEQPKAEAKATPTPKQPKVNKMFKDYNDIAEAATKAALEGNVEESTKLIAQANAVKAAMALQSDAPHKQAQRPPFFEPEGEGKTVKATTGKPENFLFYRAVKSMMDGKTDKVFMHIEGEQLFIDSTNAAIKAMSGDSSSNGGTWVPNIQSNQVIDFLYSQTVLRKAGITVIPMANNTGGSITIPSFSTGFTANWVGAGTAVTSTDVTTGSVTLSPHELAGMATLAKSLINDSNPQIESYIRNGLASAIGEKLDIAGLEGSGTAPEPRGLRNVVGVTKTAIGSQTTLDALIDAHARMSVSKIPVQKRVLICRPEIYYGLLKLKDTTGQYVVLGGYEGAGAVTDAAPVIRRLGTPIYVTNQIKNDAVSGAAHSYAYLLYAPEFLMGDRQTIEITGSDVAGDAWEKRQYKIMATLRADYALGRPAACEIITGVLH